MNIFISLYSGIEKAHDETTNIPAFYETIIKDLEESGNNVMVYISEKFQKDYKKIPKKLLSEIKNFNPDLFIFFNNTFFDITRYFDCPILIYEVDSPMLYSNIQNLKMRISRYKFVVSQEESYNILLNEFGVNKKNVEIIPFFTGIRAEKKDCQHNICFIGSKFLRTRFDNIYSIFMKKNPSRDEALLYLKIIDTLKNDPYITKKQLMQKYDITSEKVLSCLNLNAILACLSSANRINTLDSIADLGLGLYGLQNWATDNYNHPSLMLNYINKPTYTLKHNQDVYNSSKIGININHLQARSGFSWRVCDIMASNSCLVSEYKPNIKKLFADVNIPTFTNPSEAREICIKLLNNENMREDIVKASQEAIEKSFRFKHAKKQLENFLGMKLQGEKTLQTKYLWDKKTSQNIIKKIFKI